MRLTTVILIASLLQVSAAGFAQKITLNQRNTTLESILKEIRKQSGYDYYYDSKVISKDQRASLSVKEASIEEALKEVLEGSSLTYEIDGKIISIKKKEPSFLDNLVARFDNIDVRGVVVDGETGQALAGASVKVKGSNRATTTASNGTFYLRAVDEDAMIEISFVGFKSVELKAAKDLGTIKLEVSFSDLNEVEINKGYYTEKKKLSTGSVGRITADDIGKQPVGNPLAALYGRVPGLIITQQTGVPGGGFKVEIRGQNSLRNTPSDNGNIPLFVVDGVPFNSISMGINGMQSIYPQLSAARGSSPFNSLNPSDIESIEILKDADATSIYGSRGANGVVLITTKKGKTAQMQVDVNVYSGLGKVTRMLDLLSTEQYLEMRREAFKNDGTSPQSFDYDVNGGWDQNKYTDWQKELIGGTAKTTNGQLSISGGTSNTQYRFGGGYHKETTVFPGDYSDQRFSTNFSLVNISPNQKFRSQLTANYSIGNSNLFSQDLTSRALSYVPNAPDLLDEEGNLNWPSGVSNNPLQFTRQPYTAKSNNLLTNLTLDYELFRGLIIKSSFGLTNSLNKENSKFPKSALSPTLQALTPNTARFGNSFNNSWIIEPQVQYNVQLGVNGIHILVGSTFQEQTSESLSQSASGFSTEALMDNVGAVPNTSVNSTFTYTRYRYNAIFARINYNHDNRYLINLTGRRDGSSRFGPGKQFGNFGSVGAAWIISNESIIKNNLSWLSHGKLRTSFGVTGSDQTPNYGFLDLYNPSLPYSGIQGLGPSRLYNPDFAWEESRKMDLALELGFLQDRISLTTSWFRNRSSNQLVGYPLPPTTGFPNVQFNLDATVQNTGFEFELGLNPIKSKDITWNSSFNLSITRNKLVSYPNLAGSSYATTYVVGEPLTIIKLYEYIAVNQTMGLHEVNDVDNNGVYNAIDLRGINFIGPRFYGGFNNSLQWKGIQIDFLFQFAKQKGRNYLANFGQAPGAMVNQPIEVMNRWQKPGDVTDIQKFRSAGNTEYGRFAASNASITDASFVRLKNLSLAYQIPSSIMSKAKIKAARIYIQGQNLFVLTKYKGLDPETQGNVLPPLRFITTGIQLTF